jgi:tRNA nucleotidyltransferase (CCA-adding enzyme)
LDDLKNGIIQTPLDPKTTFDDDPLRVLRCVRFASRLGYTVEESVAQAGRDKQTHHVLATKISRERIAEELDKMIKGA